MYDLADQPLTLVQDIRDRLQKLRIPHDLVEALMVIVTQHAQRLPAFLPAPKPPRAQTHAEIARSFYKASLKRADYFGEKLVADTAWNMLLDLFAANEEGRPVSVSSLCIASGGPPTTALRHLQRMNEMHIVHRTADERDGRRIWVETTPETRAVMRRLIEDFCVAPPAAA